MSKIIEMIDRRIDLLTKNIGILEADNMPENESCQRLIKHFEACMYELKSLRLEYNIWNKYS